MLKSVDTKPGKNQFKCYSCRLVFANKDGDWIDWDQMQVHLCRSCEKKTQEDKSRNSGQQKAKSF